jgi:hypothetical protein
MFNITLSNGKKINIILIDLRKKTIDFQWVEGSDYSGDCSFECESLDGFNNFVGKITNCANEKLVD